MARASSQEQGLMPQRGTKTVPQGHPIPSGNCGTMPKCLRMHCVNEFHISNSHIVQACSGSQDVNPQARKSLRVVMVMQVAVQARKSKKLHHRGVMKFWWKQDQGGLVKCDLQFLGRHVRSIRNKVFSSGNGTSRSIRHWCGEDL